MLGRCLIRNGRTRAFNRVAKFPSRIAVAALFRCPYVSHAERDKSCDGQATVTTTARSMLPPEPRAPKFPPLVKVQPGLVSFLLFLAFVILVLRWPSSQRAATAFAALLFCAGCGGGTTPPHGTPPGTYTVTVTATSGSLTHTIALTLTVNYPFDLGQGTIEAALGRRWGVRYSDIPFLRVGDG